MVKKQRNRNNFCRTPSDGMCPVLYLDDHPIQGSFPEIPENPEKRLPTSLFVQTKHLWEEGGGCLVDTLIQKDFLRGRKGTELWNGFNDFGTSRKSQGKTPRITGNKWHGLAPVVPATQLIVYQLLFDLSCCPEVTVVASRQWSALSFWVRQFDGQRGLQSHSSHDFGKAVAGAASHRRSEPPSTGARAAALGVLCLRPPLTEQMF